MPYAGYLPTTVLFVLLLALRVGYRRALPLGCAVLSAVIIVLLFKTILSVFYVHNVIPGPQLFQNTIDLVYGLYFSLIALNTIVMVFLLFSTNILARIIRVPTRFLGVMILLLSFMGVYSLSNSLSDYMIAAGFGMLGLILKRLNLPIVPIILGMVLGGIMEVKLRSALPRLKTPLDMIDRPVAFIYFAIILLVLAINLRTWLKEFRAPAT